MHPFPPFRFVLVTATRCLTPIMLALAFTETSLSMTARSLQEHLTSGDSMARLAAHAQRLLQFQRRLEVALPEALRPHARVANFRLGKLFIHAANGAVAAKVRQLGTASRQRFIEQGGEGYPNRGPSASPETHLRHSLHTKEPLRQDLNRSKDSLHWRRVYPASPLSRTRWSVCSRSVKE